MSIKDHVYIITGGSKGFGLATAKVLIEKGAKVGLISRGQESLDKAVAELGDNAFGVPADVGNGESLAKAFTAIKEHFGRLDGLVNNAGNAYPNKIENLVEEEVMLQVNTNFMGTVLGCKAVIPLLRGADNPRIINISSASAFHFDEMCHLSIYASLKAGVERFTRELARELQEDEIGVTCVRPGGAGTDFANGWDGEALTEGFAAWGDIGKYMSVGMEAKDVGESIAYALAQPSGVAIDLLEVRPNKRMAKF